MEVNGQRYAPAAVPPGERVPNTHWIGGCVGSRAGLDAVAKRTKSFLYPCRESNHSRPVPPSHCTLWTIPAS
jgi:hypothetical protein